MNLQELEQVKKDLANGVIVSRGTWEKVLAHAIEIEASDVSKEYYELLYNVSKKYPNETRHQTALRYIKICEEPKNIMAEKCKS